MITVSLIGGRTPPFVQVVVSATPVGKHWTLTGTAADGRTWVVPDGRGIGDGQQLNLADNRAPLNSAVTYTLTAETSSQTSAPITVEVDVPAHMSPPGGGAMVLQTLNGQKSVLVGVLAGSLDIKLPVTRARYTVPGRPRPVVRYSETGDIAGALRVYVEAADFATFAELFATGEPLLWRCTGPVFDLPAVAVIDYEEPSAGAMTQRRARVWTLPYTLVDDPFMDQRIGAFTWDYTDALQVQGSTIIRDAVAMEAALAGLTGDQTDAFDWSVLA